MANCFVKVRILLSQLISGEYKARITKVVLAFAIYGLISPDILKIYGYPTSLSIPFAKLFKFSKRNYLFCFLFKILAMYKIISYQ